MKLFLLLLLILISAPIFSQTYSSTCTATGDMEGIYRTDAQRLAITRLQQINSPLKDSVVISAITTDSISRVLYAIENMQWSPLKDTIMNLFGFRNFNKNVDFESDSSHIISTGLTGARPRLKLLSVTVTNNSPWGISWAAGNYYATPNDTINRLMNLYGLQVTPIAPQYQI
ncbi:MAG: hypothetical protein JWQ96_2393 [Segetibacter sp.]|nr:hypothetical protein [Segetibacter sp.]